MAHIIVIGNEKGGTGKSTIAMHLIVSFLYEGKKTASIDLDGKQGTLTNYIRNRALFAERHDIALGLPEHLVLPPVTTVDEAALTSEIEALSERSDVIVIDTPGSDHPLAKLGHRYADTLITPLNDSLIDFDLLGKVDPETLEIKSPSHYAEAVWKVRQEKAAHGQKPLDWIVLRNRLSPIDNRNKKTMDKLISNLSGRISFRVASGLTERVIYREMFLKGMTLLDLKAQSFLSEFSFSHVGARQELRKLLESLAFPFMEKK